MNTGVRFRTYQAFRQHLFQNHNSNRRLNNEISIAYVKHEICAFTSNDIKSIITLQ